MQAYQCHKIVHAKPMTRGEWQNYKHSAPETPEALSDNQEGFLVVYSKDTPDEYESWSPKKAFDEGYTPLS